MNDVVSSVRERVGRTSGGCGGVTSKFAGKCDCTLWRSKLLLRRCEVS